MADAEKAYLGSVKCDGTTVERVIDAPFKSKKLEAETTAFTETAVSREVTIDDAEFSFKFIREAGAAGQNKVFASFAAGTSLTYIRYLNASSEYATLTAKVLEMSSSKGPKDVVEWDVKLSISGGATVTYT